VWAKTATSRPRPRVGGEVAFPTFWPSLPSNNRQAQRVISRIQIAVPTSPASWPASFDADDANQAMLLERCEPGSDLRELPEPRQDEVIAALLLRLWHRPLGGASVPVLSDMIRSWSQETTAHRASWTDKRLVEAGLKVLEDLSRSSKDEDQVLLATDLHAGNVLRAQREPWLAIDPKPFVGDRSYDATQHLFNCESRLRADPLGTIGGFSGLLHVSA
jgi:streptomycin 6-kinase